MVEWENVDDIMEGTPEEPECFCVAIANMGNPQPSNENE